MPLSLTKQLQKSISLRVLEGLKGVELTLNRSEGFGHWAVVKPIMATTLSSRGYAKSPMLGDERFFRSREYINGGGEIIFVFSPAFSADFSQMELDLDSIKHVMPEFYSAVDDQVDLDCIHDTELMLLTSEKGDLSDSKPKPIIKITSAVNKYWGQFE